MIIVSKLQKAILEHQLCRNFVLTDIVSYYHILRLS